MSQNSNGGVRTWFAQIHEEEQQLQQHQQRQLHQQHQQQKTGPSN